MAKRTTTQTPTEENLENVQEATGGENVSQEVEQTADNSIPEDLVTIVGQEKEIDDTQFEKEEVKLPYLQPNVCSNFRLHMCTVHCSEQKRNLFFSSLPFPNIGL